MRKLMLIVAALAGVASNAGAVSYIQSRSTLQSGATFYVSSGTVQGQLTVGSINVTGGAGAFIENRATLQTGATFYVSSGSVQGNLNLNTAATAANHAVRYSQLFFYANFASTQNVAFASATVATSYVPLGLSVTITPSDATKRIYLTVTIGRNDLPANNSCFATLFRNGVNDNNAPGSVDAMIQHGGIAAGAFAQPFSFNWISSPGSASAQTYELYGRSSAGGNCVYGGNDTVSSIHAWEIPAP